MVILQIDNQHNSQLLQFISFHTIMNTQNESEGLSLACNEAGLQTIHGFSRMQNLGSRRAFIHRSFFFFNLPASIVMPQAQ